jgi:hypothetical protein
VTDFLGRPRWGFLGDLQRKGHHRVPGKYPGESPGLCGGITLRAEALWLSFAGIPRESGKVCHGHTLSPLPAHRALTQVPWTSMFSAGQQ